MIALALLAACGGGDGGSGADVEISGVQLQVVDDVRTVVRARWTTTPAASSWIELPDGRATPADEPAEEHEVLLLGLPPETEVPVTVAAGDPADPVRVDGGSVTTGSLPADIAPPVAEGDGPDAFMAVPMLGAVTAAVVLDGQGRVVWYHLDDSGLDVYRVRPARDGSGVLYNQASISGDPAEDSAIVRVSWDGSEVERVDVPLLAHDFVELPDGTIAAIGVVYRDWNGEELRGDRIVEIAPDGSQTTAWTSWDCFDPGQHWGDDSEYGWTFANALDYDEANDRYLLGLRNFSSIVAIDRATGQCAWAVGGVASTLEVQGDTFLHQHQFELDGDRLLVFDNDGAAGTVSRVLDYDLDWDAGRATARWSWQPDPSVYNFVLGDVHRFEDDAVLATFSVAGQIDLVSPEGEVRWQANTQMGFALGFDTVVEDLYAPAE